MREQTKKDIYAAHAVGIEYDRACKRVFQNREIIAPILQMVVPEYEECTVKEVLRYIEEDTIRDVPLALGDTLTSYSIRRTDLIGVTEEPEEEYDLLNVIMIRRGGKSKDKIFDFLRAVFDGEIGKLEEYTYISQNAVLRQEVEHMSGLGASIYEEGMEQGVERATENFIRRMFDGNESLEKIATYAGCTVEEVLRIKETFGGDAE